MEKIEPPSSCPNCNGEVEWRNDLLFCINFSCSAKTTKRIEHFTKTLKIKGLGPKSIAKLCIEEPYELYDLDLDVLEELLESKKLAVKILEEIDKSRQCDLEEVLPAFSIPLMGKSASKKLCEVVSDISEIRPESCKEAGLGPKVVQNLLSWIETEEYKNYPFDFKRKEKYSESLKSLGVVCISGKLSSFKTKAEAKKALEAVGYEVKDTVTKEVTILVNESGIESSKTQKARNNGITIITNLRNLLEN